jgi:hypothetical protein
MHVDSSFFTFNVLLSDPSDFEGKPLPVRYTLLAYGVSYMEGCPGGEIYIFTPQQVSKRLRRLYMHTPPCKIRALCIHGVSYREELVLRHRSL